MAHRTIGLGPVRAAIACGLLAIIVAYPTLALTGCDPTIDESGIEVDASGNVSDEEQVRRRVSALGDTLQDPTDDTLDAYIAQLSNDQRLAIDLIRINGIDITELCGKLFASSSFEIGDVVVDGDSATVALHIDHKPFGSIANTTNAQFSELLDGDEGAQLLAEGVPALLGRYERMYLDDLQSTDAVASDDVSVRLERRGGSWSITAESVQDIAAALVQGVDLQYGQ